MYYDVLSKIKNAQAVRKKSLKVPYSRMDFGVVEALARKGLIKSGERKGKGYKRVIVVVLQEAGRQISEVKLVSRPSRRIYHGYKDIKPVRQGFGIAVLSTPKGILTGEEARKQKIGGELLFYAW